MNFRSLWKLLSRDRNKPGENAVRQMWGQGFGPAAELPLAPLDPKQSNQPNSVFSGAVPPAIPPTPELRAEIRRSFDDASRDEEHFPSTIDPRIQHVRILLRFFGDLTDKRVLDVGCGKGRFARVLQEEQPGAAIWGLDISGEMLKFLPAGIHRLAGSMTALPVADSTFDAVYATESLEHAIEIDQAVNEMCRVLKPGGKLAIIDKNAEHWGKLETPRWEKWFKRDELERLLRQNRLEVHSQYISYWDDVAPDGLFLVWFGRKL